jgi:hypothetical protein
LSLEGLSLIPLKRLEWLKRLPHRLEYRPLRCLGARGPGPGLPGQSLANGPLGSLTIGKDKGSRSFVSSSGWSARLGCPAGR